MHVTRPTLRRLAAPVVGFGLFKALLDRTYSSAMSTASGAFPIVNDLAFSLAASLAIIVFAALLLAVSWRRPSFVPRASACACLALLAAVNCLSGLGLLAELPAGAALALTSASYGAGSTVPNAAWLVCVAALPAGECLLALAASYLLAALVSPLIAALPLAAGGWVACAVCLASAALLVRELRLGTIKAPLRGTDGGRDDGGPDGRADGAATQPSIPSLRSARAALAPVAGPLAVFLALEMIMGLVMSFQVASLEGAASVAGAASTVGAAGPGAGGGAGGVSFAKAAASVLAYAGLAAVALGKRGLPDIRLLFERLFPLVALALVALPFTGSAYGAAFSVALVFLQGAVGTSVLFLLLQASREHGIPVVATVAAVSLAARLFILAGLALGRAVGVAEGVDATARALTVAVAALYMLSMVLVWLLKTKGRAGNAAGAAGAPPSAEAVDAVREGCAESGASDGSLPGSEPPQPEVAFDEVVRRIARDRGLTAREEQVVLLVARGRSAVRISEELGLSAETVRSYLKSAYPKLGVHSKQELIDLFSPKVGSHGRRSPRSTQGGTMFVGRARE